VRRLPQILIAAALVLASVSGYFVATSFGAGTQAAVTTTTITLTAGPTGPAGPTGAQGPPGPAGPPGPGGAESCPAGYSFGAVVVNHAGGRLEIATCIKS